MRVKLEYGRTGLVAELPDERVVRTLHYKDAPPLADPGSETHAMRSAARLIASPECGAAAPDCKANRQKQPAYENSSDDNFRRAASVAGSVMPQASVILRPML